MRHMSPKPGKTGNRNDRLKSEMSASVPKAFRQGVTTSRSWWRVSAKSIVVLGISALSLWLAVSGMRGAAAASSQPGVQAARVVVPNVVGFRMDRATRTLHSRGLRVNEECSGVFGCILKSRWWICDQSPRAGRRVSRYSVVVIYGERRGQC